MAENLVAVGKIIGYQGLKGEVKVLPLTDYPQRFKSLKKVKLVLNKKITSVEVETGREQKKLWIIKFKNYDSLEEVQPLKESYIMIPREERMALPDDRYYIDDLIGLSVFTGDNKLGEVIDVLQTGGNDVFVVKPQDPSYPRDILIPVLKDVIEEISLQGKKVKVILPEGLLD